MAKIFPFSALPTADLVIDAVYEGGTEGNTADDVLGKLIAGAGNQGGFRAVGSWDAPRLVILYSSMDDADWPDFIDVYTGVFTYFGDNKKPGFDLHDTPRRGNKLLQACFTSLHNAPYQRVKIPPFLVFTKGQKGRDAVFRGLAVPGVEADPADDLVAIPHGFEHCAARLAGLMDPNIKIETVTRPSVDGGRDAIGTYRVGPLADRIALDFALEAKCYAPENGVGVKERSRLISRLRHRQFGILVTTSFLGHQAYQELRSDRHPVVVIAGADIAAILVRAGLGTPEAVREWLIAEFPEETR